MATNRSTERKSWFDLSRSAPHSGHFYGDVVSSGAGKSVRHRLNRHGNCDANRALYVLAVCRMSRDKRTRTYVAKRTTEGKTKKEIIRCLKRYIAREVYRILVSLSLNKPPISAP